MNNLKDDSHGEVKEELLYPDTFITKICSTENTPPSNDFLLTILRYIV